MKHKRRPHRGDDEYDWKDLRPDPQPLPWVGHVKNIYTSPTNDYAFVTDAGEAVSPRYGVWNCRDKGRPEHCHYLLATTDDLAAAQTRCDQVLPNMRKQTTEPVDFRVIDQAQTMRVTGVDLQTGEQVGTLEFHNDGPTLVATNFWEGVLATHNKCFCSVNAGTIRVLLPPEWLANADLMAGMQAATLCILTRSADASADDGTGPAVAGSGDTWEEPIEILFEDGSDSPVVIHVTARSFDCLPAEPPPGKPWHLAVYGPGPTKRLERVCQWRRGPASFETPLTPLTPCVSSDPDKLDSIHIDSVHANARTRRWVSFSDHYDEARPYVVWQCFENAEGKHDHQLLLATADQAEALRLCDEDARPIAEIAAATIERFGYGLKPTTVH